MIKTTELMLGNLVEYRNKYYAVGTIFQNEVLLPSVYGRIDCKDINPIPLTEGVLKRLGSVSVSFKSVHQYQNWVKAGDDILDITPLLSPRYTTHDGVEVWEGDEVWYTFTNPKNNDTPQKWIVGVDMDNTRYLYFSIKEKAQSYIDKVTRKPIFTTEDGVDVFEGDEYYATSISGYDKYGYEAIVDKIKVPKVWEGDDTKVRFANKETAKKYLQWVLTKSQAEKAEAEYQSLLKSTS